MSDNQKKITIDLEVIETPRGNVVSLESVKSIINALNLLNVEMITSNESINDEVINKMINIERELKAIRKLLAENTITNEALKENIREMNENLKKGMLETNEKFTNLTEVISNFEKNIEKKIVSSLAQFIEGSEG